MQNFSSAVINQAHLKNSIENYYHQNSVFMIYNEVGFNFFELPKKRIFFRRKNDEKLF